VSLSRYYTIWTRSLQSCTHIAVDCIAALICTVCFAEARAVHLCNSAAWFCSSVMLFARFHTSHPGFFCNHGRSCSERAVRSYNVRSCSSSLLPLTLLMHNYCSATAAHDSSGSGPAEKASSQRKPLPYYHVLLNAPNCVGWVRLSLLLLAVWKAGHGAHMATFCLCIVNMMLDFVDGWAARRFQQVSALSLSTSHDEQ